MESCIEGLIIVNKVRGRSVWEGEIHACSLERRFLFLNSKFSELHTDHCCICATAEPPRATRITP